MTTVMKQKSTRMAANLAFMGVAAALATCSPANPKVESAEAATAPGAREEAAMIAPSKTGYAEVNGLKIYHEIYGSGDPLVLMPGGLTTIPEMQTWIQPLAKTHQVIALELQGHGRTADTDRPFTMKALGDDVAGLLDALDIPKADIAGHSLGAAAAIRTAIQHPEKVDRLVIVSTPARFKGWYPEGQEGMSQVGAAMAESMMETPTGKFSKAWPQPERFPAFLDKLGKEMATDYDWTAEIRKLQMPTLLVFADHDSMPVTHIAEFYSLFGGGVSEPGWQNTKFTRARLAIIPGYSHYNLGSSPEVPAVVANFLDGKLEGAGQAAAASQVAQ